MELREALAHFHPPEEWIGRQVGEIYGAVLTHSPYIRQPDFVVIHTSDLETLFEAYDQRFFGGLFRPALGARPLRFELSRRMTKAGGITRRFTTPDGIVRFEIAVAIGMLFDGFRAPSRRITVCGLDCQNRLEALQRIFEHELVHLAELLCWDRSDCAAARFQEIAQRLFRHRAHTHDLVTRREMAAAAGIRPGSRVTFVFEGSRLTGRVNRITKRATVLVEHPQGQPYSDGLRYKAYYVPIAHLEQA